MQKQVKIILYPLLLIFCISSCKNASFTSRRYSPGKFREHIARPHTKTTAEDLQAGEFICVSGGGQYRPKHTTVLAKAKIAANANSENSFAESAKSLPVHKSFSESDTEKSHIPGSGHKVKQTRENSAKHAARIFFILFLGFTLLTVVLTLFLLNGPVPYILTFISVIFASCAFISLFFSLLFFIIYSSSY